MTQPALRPARRLLPCAPAAIASVFAVLVCCSGLFSGLTLGVLSLDLVGLRILEKGGEEWERVYARKIMPVRAKGNLLLCTLLFGNTVVNAGIAILLSSLTSGECAVQPASACQSSHALHFSS